ncbi:MAG TPA: hypothetical protein VG675_05040 [Bryobacteraceae bacterium]|nr:hypothetical protein [Bryobacteraceae bacterium]
MCRTPSPEVRLTRLVHLIFGLHQIATGREMSHEDAHRYFSDPRALAETLRTSGALRDPEKSQQIEELLTRCRDESQHCAKRNQGEEPGDEF